MPLEQLVPLIIVGVGETDSATYHILFAGDLAGRRQKTCSSFPVRREHCDYSEARTVPATEMIAINIA
ncbi:hypothetical protein [Novosphingobium album (ex Liu et al. 2023)]|uniref:hypothetical protein n=1 Tax=Novosphingobium album (ex Liu et al. 2023) TaxID=3031130 RepID=UPI0023B0620D|nr:hypothetical protein [Novosphingobium album (ex Liu et al. 2023)]